MCSLSWLVCRNWGNQFPWHTRWCKPQNSRRESTPKPSQRCRAAMALGETLLAGMGLAAGSAVDFGYFFGIQTEGRVDLADGVLQFVFCGHHGNTNLGSGDQINVGASFVQSIEEGC